MNRQVAMDDRTNIEGNQLGGVCFLTASAVPHSCNLSRHEYGTSRGCFCKAAALTTPQDGSALPASPRSRRAVKQVFASQERGPCELFKRSLHRDSDIDLFKTLPECRLESVRHRCKTSPSEGCLEHPEPLPFQTQPSPIPSNACQDGGQRDVVIDGEGLQVQILAVA
jgi:hypothetical protein